VDFFEYLGEDPETEIIVSYLEGIKDGKKFNHLIREISRRKPIILWKCGEGEAGVRAAASHTGTIAGAAPIWKGVLNGAGIVQVNSLEEILDTLCAFYFQPLPKGKRIGIISGPGGPAVGTTDACLAHIRSTLTIPKTTNYARIKHFLCQEDSLAGRTVGFHFLEAINDQAQPSLFADRPEATSWTAPESV
jgi:acyl-CoA synthetase (NDP forming)